jgi:predicted nucleic acid-binding protein
VKVLFDTNVVLDVLLNRHPHVAVASQLMVKVEQRRVAGLVGATTVTTIHYLASKAIGPARAGRHIHALLSLFDVAPVDKDVLLGALSLNFSDYEDAVLHEAARRAGAKGIVTRDAAGFSVGRLRVYSPDELLGMLEAAGTP